MSTLLLTLAAPLQAWGTSSRFALRGTDDHPSKSGVLGLLAAALGRRRTDPVEDLLDLRFGVRIDQPGSVVRDFQTAHTAKGASAPISQRFYLGDAVFLAAVEGEHELISALHGALRRPTFPLYLGRRACPPAGPIPVAIREAGLRDVLRSEPWRASAARRRRASRDVDVELVVDAVPEDDRDGGAIAALIRDVPLSFDPHRREYGTRRVVRLRTTIPNPDGREPVSVGSVGGHDPFDAWEA